MPRSCDPFFRSALCLFCIIVIGCTSRPHAATGQPATGQPANGQQQANGQQTVTNSTPDSADESATPAADSSGEVANHPHEDLDATLWMRTSAEYGAITKMVYRAATDRLQLAIDDPAWSAIPDLHADSSLPLAVIVDVDETVLDNSGYQVRMIQDDHEYIKEEWNAFVSSKTSKAVPGAKQFIDACRNADVTVFFVTNREQSVEAPTRENLVSEGLVSPAAAEDVDTLLCKYEQDEWTSDKTSRRMHVAESYRVLFIVGDDLNDFVPVGNKPTSAERKALAEKYDEFWGRKWFTLPNPNYGGWERAIYHFQDALPHETKLRKKREALVPTQ